MHQIQIQPELTALTRPIAGY